MLSRSETLYPAESVSPLRGHIVRRNWSRTPARRLPLAPPSGRTNDPASSVRSGTGVSNPQKGTPLSCQYSLRNPKDVWQHPSPAPEVQKLYLSHPGFEPKTCPFRERAANQLSQSEVVVPSKNANLLGIVPISTPRSFGGPMLDGATSF